MKIYRFFHKPTGLYYCNTRQKAVSKGTDSGRVKTNLSVEGKVYTKKPSMSFLRAGYSLQKDEYAIYSHLNVDWIYNQYWLRHDAQSRFTTGHISDWELKEYEI